MEHISILPAEDVFSRKPKLHGGQSESVFEHELLNLPKPNIQSPTLRIYSKLNWIGSFRSQNSQHMLYQLHEQMAQQSLKHSNIIK